MKGCDGGRWPGLWTGCGGEIPLGASVGVVDVERALRSWVDALLPPTWELGSGGDILWDGGGDGSGKDGFLPRGGGRFVVDVVDAPVVRVSSFHVGREGRHDRSV